MKGVNNILFIYGVFNDNHSTSDYLGLNGGMTSELWVTKNVERTLNVYRPPFKLQCNHRWPEYFCF
jgi:hypothetical protein